MKVLWTFLLILLPVLIYSQLPLSSYDSKQLFGSSGELHFILKDAAPFTGELSAFISVDNVKGNDVYAYANMKGFERLKTAFNFTLIKLDHPANLAEQLTTESPRGIMAWDSYPTYQDYLQLMNDFAINYPFLCKIDTIGVLASGRLLIAARISDNVGIDEDEPEFLYTSSMHGDETTGYILLLHLIDYLLTNYNVNQKVADLVNNIDIWINPLANPDGTYAGGNSTVNGATRFNTNFVDLNRNYPDPKDGPHPDDELWQPETVFFMNFAEKRDFVMSANLHDGAEVVNYPWDTWSRKAADDNWWQQVSRQYADTVHKFSPQGYFTDLNNGISNGYEWYTINGGRQDYMNYFHQCREVTIEVSSIKILPANQLLNFWNYHYRSLLNYMQQVLYGIRGTVTDSISGAPLESQVLISDLDKDSSMVFSSLPVGNYHRLIKAGTYDVTFMADGYMPKTVMNVVVADNQSLKLDVQLWPDIVGINESEFIDISVYPNPVQDGRLFVRSSNTINEYYLIDLLGKQIMRKSLLSKETMIDLGSLNNGVYLLKVIGVKGTQIFKIVVN